MELAVVIVVMVVASAMSGESGNPFLSLNRS